MHFGLETRYNSNLDTIDTKSIINQDLKDSIEIELPIPNGKRFDSFQRLGRIDSELRAKITTREYTKAEKLITFLNKIYKPNRFNDLKEITIRNSIYYFILKADGTYIREDYLSSGEFFVISLYKLLMQGKKLIVIDEIDISLDASAQVNLLKVLKCFCNENEVNILFTTQSLTLMRSFSSDGGLLNYMEEEKDSKGTVIIKEKSYNYVKGILYGFKGWDKYILTEDVVLKKYLEFLLKSKVINKKYKIIYIGAATSTVSLMNRNAEEEFFESAENVISILDGDQKDESCKNNSVYFIPFESVEKKLFHEYKKNSNNFGLEVANNSNNKYKNPKNLYKNIQQNNTEDDTFTYLNTLKHSEVDAFVGEIIKFLNK